MNKENGTDKYKDINRYSDIIDLPHPISKKHPRMPLENRAAQFAPFAALTGHDAAVRETARRTEERVEPDESVTILLNRKLHYIMEHISEQPEIRITWFRPDERKPGGAYVTTEGAVKKLDLLRHQIILNDETEIPMEEVIDLDGEIF